MPSEKPLHRLEDILENIEAIEHFTADMDFERFAQSKVTLYATLHALLIVSEAARKLGGLAETLMPGQPWRDIRSVGNVLRHDYDGIDPAAIWRVLRNGDLTSLREAVASVVARLRSERRP